MVPGKLAALFYLAALLCLSLPRATLSMQITSPAALVAVLPNGGIPDIIPSLITGMPVAPETPLATEAVFQTPFVPESCTATNSPADVAGKVFFMWGLPATGGPGCSSKEKVLLAESLGAAALVVVYPIPGVFGVGMYTFPDPFLDNKIPSYMMRFEQGMAIYGMAAAGVPVTIDLFQNRLPSSELTNLRDLYYQGSGQSWSYLIPGVMDVTWHLFKASPPAETEAEDAAASARRRGATAALPEPEEDRAAAEARDSRVRALMERPGGPHGGSAIPVPREAEELAAELRDAIERARRAVSSRASSSQASSSQASSSQASSSKVSSARVSSPSSPSRDDLPRGELDEREALLARFLAASAAETAIEEHHPDPAVRAAISSERRRSPEDRAADVRARSRAHGVARRNSGEVVLPGGADPARNKWPLVFFTPDGYVIQTGFLATPMPGPFPSAVLKMTRIRFMAFALAGFIGDFPNLSPLKGLWYVNLKDSFLTGSIPAEMAELESLETFDVANNRLSGELPAAVLSSWTNIAVLNLRSSRLSGELPPFGTWATKLTRLNLNGNSFSGQIPSDVGTAPGLTEIDLTGNNLSGGIPDFSSLTKLQILRLRGNSLSGPIPESFARLTSLTSVDLANNRLSGPVTVNLTALTAVSQVFLYNNLLEGSVPGDAILPPNTAFLDLSGNRFTSMTSLRGLSSLKRFSIADNLVAGDINTFVTRMLPTSTSATAGIEEIDVSGNQFESLATTPFTTFFEGPFRSLRVYNAARNAFSGILLFSGNSNTYPNLEKIDVSGNKGLVNSIPAAVGEFPVLKDFDIRNTSMVHAAPEGDPDQVIPSFVSSSFALAAFDESRHWWCPQLIGNALNTMVVHHDPAFHKGTLCQCDRDYRNNGNATCIRCPTEATECPGFEKDTVIRFKPGYYPSPPENPLFAIRCYDDALSGTACNPDGTDEFRCRKGFEGRLCSQCQPDHFERNRRCEVCNPFGALVVAVAVLLVIGVLVIVLWRVGAIGYEGLARSADKDRYNWYFDAEGHRLNGDDASVINAARAHSHSSHSSGSAPPPGFRPSTSVSFLTLLTIFVNYLQTTSIALDGMQLGDELGVIKSIYEISSFTLGEMGLECITSSMTHERRYVVTWIFPLCIIGVVWTVALTVKLIRKIRGMPQRHAAKLALGFSLLVVNFSYFPFAKLSLSKYRCVLDPGLGTRYLADAPYVECDAIDPIGKLLPLLIYVVGGMLCLAGFSLYGGLRGALLGDSYFRIFGWFYVGFKPKYWFFPLLLTQRKLLLALVTGLAAEEDVFRYTSVIGVLAGAMFLTCYVKPYKYLYANRLDSFASFMGVLIYGNSLIISNPDTEDNEGILIAITFALHLVTLTCFLVAFGSWMRLRIAAAQARRTYETKVLPVDSPSSTEMEANASQATNAWVAD